VKAKVKVYDGDGDGGSCPHDQGRRYILAAGILAMGSMLATPDTHASAIPLIDHLTGSNTEEQQIAGGQQQENDPLVKVARGKQLFEAHCATCHSIPVHGTPGENVFAPGRTLTRDALAKHGIELSQESISYFIRDKRVHRGVFAFSHLENGEIRN
jgi:cytochrome c5